MTKWLFAASLCACGTPHAANDANVADDGHVDAHPDAGQCWPYDTSTPKGSVELGVGDGSPGTGEGTFVPIGDDVTLEFGSQGGFDIALRARIHGLEPGDPSTRANPTNPRTMVNNYDLVTNQPTYVNPCPDRVGYSPDGSDSYVEADAEKSLFFEALTAHDLFGKQFRVTIEVIDSTGGYATASKVVTVHAPPGWFMDAGT